MNYLKIVIAVLATLIAGCKQPAEWAENVESQVRCDMSLNDVGVLVDRPVQKMEVPRGWMTHLVRDGNTELWLGFEENKLKWLQVAWAAKMMRMATYQRVDMCGLEPANPDVVHPLVNN